LPYYHDVSSFFNDKTIVIIGGTGVLGAELAKQLLAAGATVKIVARTPLRVSDELAEVPVAQAEISSRDSLAAALDELGGPVDGIINAAGVVAFGSLTEVPEEIVAELLRTNAQGVVNLLAEGAHRVTEGGFITSLTGVAADVDVLGMSAYCASKAAAKKTMAIGSRELRSKKISVLDVRAPHTETGLVTRALFGAAPKMPEGLTPEFVASRILKALELGEKDLPADSFSA